MENKNNLKPVTHGSIQDPKLPHPATFSRDTCTDYQIPKDNTKYNVLFNLLTVDNQQDIVSSTGITGNCQTLISGSTDINKYPNIGIKSSEIMGDFINRIILRQEEIIKELLDSNREEFQPSITHGETVIHKLKNLL